MAELIAAAFLALAVVAAEPPLPALLAQMRVSVPDARSITDLQVCPPQQVSGDGQRFTILLALNRPQTARGYYRAVWREGRFVVVEDLGFATNPYQGLAQWGARQLQRKFDAQCRWVSADELAAGWAQVR